MGFNKIGFVLFILIFILMFSIIFPFYTNIQEGAETSFTPTDISNIQQVIDVYNNKVDTGSCYIALTQISKTAGNDSEIMGIISNNSDLSNCDLVDKIAALNNKNRPKLLDAINKCYGIKYAEVLNFVDSLKRLDVYSSNTNFSTYVENSVRTPVVSGSKSTVNMIQQYMDSMAVMNKVASINSAATSPAPTTKK